jgi:uncharacterized tellurite resistance protein B-like protein
MLNFFKDLFSNNKSNTQATEKEENNALQIASCALFLELANADDDFSNEEKTRIVELMKNNFKLTDEEVNKLLELSQKQIDKSVSAYEFTEIINEKLSEEEKYQIIKNLWQLAYVDGKLDKYEDYYIRKISNNLHISNQDRISAKLEVKKKLNL